MALAGYGLHVATGFAGDALATILYLAAVAGGVVAATVAARARPGWPSAMFAFAIAGYGFASVYYALVPDAADRFPSTYDIPLFAFYPLVFVAFAGFVRRQNAELSGALALDAVLGALIVSALGATALSPLVEPGESARVTGQMVYVLADLSFFGFLIAVYTLSGLREGVTLMVLATGAVLLAVGDGSYFIDVASGNPAPDAVSVLAWPAAMLVLVLAPYLGQRRAAPRSSTWARIGIPGAAAVTGAPIELLSTGLSPQRLLAAAALILVVVRLMVSLHQNSRLLASAHVAATTDRLTGLANREALSDRLERALARRAGGGDVAVMFLDLDEFKAINDTHGHDVGDQVLISVAERLSRALRCGDTAPRRRLVHEAGRPRDTVGRLGGDEFVVLIEGLGDPGAAVVVADRILDEVRASLVVGELTIFLDTSIGITTSCAHDDRGPDELLRDADTAMYEAKRAGRHRHEVFEPAMRERVVVRAEMLQALRMAVASGQLRVLYQPQVDLASGRMTAVEALVRWEHPQQGLLAPDRFIPLAETAGLIADIDDWVLREACAQLRRWDDAGMPALGMAVNVSSRRLGGDLAATVAEVLRATGIDATRLEVEITESGAVEQDSAGVAAIAGVQELGVSVALDDFGMGHSALSRLQTFPVDRLKIDRSFVAPLLEGAERGTLADAMIAMAQSLGLRVVAEGVETHEQLRALRALGCPTAQGYLFSRPVDAEAIERLARADAGLVPLEAEEAVGRTADRTLTAVPQERLVRSLLAELERLTGLESTYLTRIDWAKSVQHITHVRNAGALDIREGLAVNWSDTVCRRALEQGVTYTDDVPGTFPDSAAARDLGLQTYVSVPLVNADGDVEGTLCGASSRPVPLGPAAVQVMERFAHLIAHGVTGSPRHPLVAASHAE